MMYPALIFALKCGAIGALLRVVLRAALAQNNEKPTDFLVAEIMTFFFCLLAGFIWTL